ncbi:hypothetical protein DTO013E5_6964 [Penicillium roqueforti]|nr:hypothetical protein DTO012A1_6544 [Penicillium roqueforti]KAI2750547.1 hypothetical protein DTO013F2_4616 [Penicillium roqueforti]KAI3106869.1 hypothetical protein CBS147333_6504 [Penicillium roqueforti]KAI3205650.1 hypothetical protein DTO013E5_6964 [Penicillium roqueforti]KAI3258981.1 hypothetical protein CBS147309_7655 [Penicillium roqueforti]
MSFPQPTPTVISREHVDEVKEATSLTPMGKGNGDDNNLGDIAQILMDQEDIEYPAEEHRKLLRNIDWRIVPLAAWVCGLRFVDKSEYSWCVSIFYFGYLTGLWVMPCYVVLGPRICFNIGIEVHSWAFRIMPYSWTIACHNHVVYTRRAASAVWFMDYDKRCSSGALLNHLLCHVTTGPIVNILAAHFPHHWSLEQFDRGAYDMCSLLFPISFQVGAGAGNIERPACVVVNLTDVVLSDCWECDNKLPRDCDQGVWVNCTEGTIIYHPQLCHSVNPNPIILLVYCIPCHDWDSFLPFSFLPDWDGESVVPS